MKYEAFTYTAQKTNRERAYVRLMVMIFIYCLFVCNLQAQKKITYGLGFDIFQTKLNNVDRENFSYYGHSFPGFTQNDRLGFGVTFLASKPIYKNLSFETGFGVTDFRSQFHFDYFYPIREKQINTNLYISLIYFKAPVNIMYYISLSDKSKINLSLGVDMKFLFWGRDNYRDILYELVGFETNYNFFIPSINYSLGYTYKMKNDKLLRFEAFYGFDIKNAVGEERGFWGFYKNISNSFYNYYGFSTKYFLTK